MLKRIIWGSISKSVMERAPCPVLLVPVHDAPRT
jgi:nucleotide-binding universal stress UspA family protein